MLAGFVKAAFFPPELCTHDFSHCKIEGSRQGRSKKVKMLYNR
jgi:hypothetical protein